MIFCRESSVCYFLRNGTKKIMMESEVLDLVEKKIKEYGVDCALRLLTWEGFLKWKNGRILNIKDIQLQPVQL